MSNSSNEVKKVSEESESMSNQKEIMIRYNGFNILLGNMKDFMQFSNNRAAFSEVFMAGYYNPLLGRIMEGDTIIDAGANIGMFTIRAAKKVGQKGNVIAIEPNPDNLKFLRQNIEINGIHSVRVIDKALYSENDTTINFEGTGVGGHITEKGGSFSVSTISLEKVVSEFCERNYWIKMDIEGGEEYIFDTGQDLSYLQFCKGIAYEVHSMRGLTLLNNRLASLGLNPSRIYYENDFIYNIWKGFLSHPKVFVSLYRGRLLSFARRVSERKDKTMNTNKDFEPGMQYAWRQ